MNLFFKPCWPARAAGGSWMRNFARDSRRCCCVTGMAPSWRSCRGARVGKPWEAMGTAGNRWEPLGTEGWEAIGEPLNGSENDIESMVTDGQRDGLWSFMMVADSWWFMMIRDCSLMMFHSGCGSIPSISAWMNIPTASLVDGHFFGGWHKWTPAGNHGEWWWMIVNAG